MDKAKLNGLMGQVLAFRDERNWKQFHTAKNLAAGAAIEASELQELFLWKTDGEIEAFLRTPEGRTRVGEELSDVLLYVLLLANHAGIDLEAACKRKLKLNAEKYPVEKSYNSSLKYTELS